MTSDVRYEIRTELKLRYLFSDMKHWLKNPGWSVRKRTTQLLDRFLLSDSTGWSGRWWRLKRSSTNWSFFSKWSWNWFRSNPGFQTSGFQPDFVSRLLVRELQISARLLCRDSFQLGEILSFSSINWSRLLSSGPVSYRLSSLVSRYVYST